MNKAVHQRNGRVRVSRPWCCLSLQNLLTFSWIKARVEQGALQLQGWYFNSEDGDLLRYNAETLGFEHV